MFYRAIAAAGAATLLLAGPAFASSPPQANMDYTSMSLSQGTITINVTGNDYDPDGDYLRVTAVETCCGASMSVVSDSQISFTPSQVGSHGFKYWVTDGAYTVQGYVFVGVSP